MSYILDTCLYRECNKPLMIGRSKYCSDDHKQAEHSIQRTERKIFSLVEISKMEFTLLLSGYVNRKVRSGVWVQEHVLVMESMIGVRLPSGASVHHRDGDRGNNDPTNLELWLSHHPSGQRVECPNCGWPNRCDEL